MEKCSITVVQNKVAKLKTQKDPILISEYRRSKCFPGLGRHRLLQAETRIQEALGTCWLGSPFATKQSEGKKHEIILDRRWDSTAQHWPSIELTGLGSIGLSHTMPRIEIRQSKQAGERPPARVSAAISQAQRRWRSQQQGASQTHHINLG